MLRAETLDFLHHIIRKCGHLTEYFILSMLILRGIRAGEKGMHLRWALVTILIVAGYAALDEYHQSFVPGRTAAVGDVLIDTSGGIAAQIVASLFVLLGKAREKRHEEERNAAAEATQSTQLRKSTHRNGDANGATAVQPFLALSACFLPPFAL